MNKGRLEAFSDGVIAILITIMVLELKTPEGLTWQALTPRVPILLTYVLSFVFLGIYWNNHHHLLQATEHVNGRILWANLHLLFWLSLTPFAMGWMSDNTAAAVPTAAYGVVLLGSAIAYWILQHEILAAHGPHFRLRAALGRDLKGNISPFLYMAGIAFAFENPRISDAIYVFVAMMWLVPDPRIERSGLGDRSEIKN
jgi:TMEM175 potassium channel family protein